LKAVEATVRIILKNNLFKY